MGSLPLQQWNWLKDAVHALAGQGWYCGQQVIDAEIIDQINSWIDQRRGDFHQAGIGRSGRQQTNIEIRGDKILWLEGDESNRGPPFVSELVDHIRVTLNRELFAAVSEFEGHFAVYPPGGFYQRHIDTFRDDDARSMSLILYLNPSWSSSDGGALRLYTDSSNGVDLEPLGGTIVLFRSRDFEHEVLLAHAERRSFTGWFK